MSSHTAVDFIPSFDPDISRIGNGKKKGTYGMGEGKDKLEPLGASVSHL
jgi:hypothetical protein